MTKETPLLMCAEMVIATLEDRKTQTRRIVRAEYQKAVGVMTHIPCPYGQPGDVIYIKETHYRWGRWRKDGLTKTGRQRWRFKAMEPNLRKVLYVAGEPIALPEKLKRTELAWHKRPSIFMPRWASRITLEITGARVERVRDITESDAIAEGVKLGPFAAPAEGYRFEYSNLWDSLNAKRKFSGGYQEKCGMAWKDNPWVWVLTFKRITP